MTQKGVRATFSCRCASESPMTRPVLDSAHLAPKALERVTHFHEDVVRHVRDTIAQNDVVVVGMAQNPHVRKVRNALTAANIPFTYIEYGSYVSEWRKRLAIKLWSGWPTFPQVFVKGTLIGGQDLTAAAIADGSLKQMLGA